MNTAVVDTSRLRKGPRNRPKGRQVEPRAAEEIAALLGDAPRQRDYLIEHLHRVQDTGGESYRQRPVGGARGVPVG